MDNKEITGKIYDMLYSCPGKFGQHTLKTDLDYYKPAKFYLSDDKQLIIWKTSFGSCQRNLTKTEIYPKLLELFREYDYFSELPGEIKCLFVVEIENARGYNGGNWFHYIDPKTAMEEQHSFGITSDFPIFIDQAMSKWSAKASTKHFVRRFDYSPQRWVDFDVDRTEWSFSIPKGSYLAFLADFKVN